MKKITLSLTLFTALATTHQVHAGYGVDLKTLNAYAPAPVTAHDLETLAVGQAKTLKNIRIVSLDRENLFRFHSDDMANVGTTEPFFVLDPSEALYAEAVAAIKSGRPVQIAAGKSADNFFYGASLIALDGRTTDYAVDAGFREYFAAYALKERTSVGEKNGRKTFEARNLRALPYLDRLAREIGNFDLRSGDSQLLLAQDSRGTTALKFASIPAAAARLNIGASNFTQVKKETLDDSQDMVYILDNDLATQLYGHLKSVPSVMERDGIAKRSTSRITRGSGVYHVQDSQRTIDCQQTVKNFQRTNNFSCIFFVRVK